MFSCVLQHAVVSYIFCIPGYVVHIRIYTWYDLQSVVLLTLVLLPRGITDQQAPREGILLLGRYARPNYYTQLAKTSVQKWIFAR